MRQDLGAKVRDYAIKALARNGRLSWSQFGEDIILRTYLPESLGTYVDIGAGHPTHLSNTFLFYQLGWQGVLVEPNPALAQLQKHYRPDDRTLDVLIGTEDADLDFFEFDPWPFSTTAHERAARLVEEGVRQVSVSRKRMVRLSTLGLFATPADPTLLTVDVEGLDLDVLKSNDWEEHRPRVVCVEEHGVRPADSSALRSLMRSEGYSLTSQTVVTSIFVHEKYLSRQ